MIHTKYTDDDGSVVEIENLWEFKFPTFKMYSEQYLKVYHLWHSS